MNDPLIDGMSAFAAWELKRILGRKEVSNIILGFYDEELAQISQAFEIAILAANELDETERWALAWEALRQFTQRVEALVNPVEHVRTREEQVRDLFEQYSLFIQEEKK